MYVLFAICILLGALKGITAFIDTSNYKILVDRARGNITFWEAQCRGLGDNWALAIVETEREGYVLANFVEISDNVLHFLIGGSTIRRLDRQMLWSHYRLDNKDVVDYGLELASTTSNYRKLIVASKNNAKNYDQWAKNCQKIGKGWAPAALNTRKELDFLKLGQKTFRNSNPYWIGGSTNRQGRPGYTVNFTQYNAYDSEINNGVMVSTTAVTKKEQFSVKFNDIEFHDKNTFRLRAESHDNPLSAILCEQERNASTSSYHFASATSYYRKIVGENNNHSYYASKCGELGSGWGAIVFESEVEFDFIEENLRTDQDQEYFVNGSYYDESFSIITYSPFSFQIYSPWQSERPVHTVWETGSDNSSGLFIKDSSANTAKSGILCEKVKLDFNGNVFDDEDMDY